MKLTLFVGTAAALALLMGGALLAQPTAAQGSISAFATNTPMPAQTLPMQISATPTLIVPTVDVQVSRTPMPTATQASPIVAQVFEPPECAYVSGQKASEACLAIIQQFPKPNVTRIRRDSLTLENYSFWRIGPQAVPKYDSPGGAIVGEHPQGFNFVQVVNQVEGWIQARDGAWYSMNDAYYVRPSEFVGVELPPGWNHPFAWVLDTTGIWASLYPGGPATSASGLVPLHHQLFNIYAEAVAEDGWTWYMVGPNQWVKQIFLSVIRPIAPPQGVTGRWVAIDLFEQSLVAYEDERPVFATLVSTGLPGTETNEGLFTVWARLARDGMSGSTGAPNAYALQSVPWVMYFDGSISLHGTYWHNFFGYRRSRGCVNLSISDARWVYEWMLRGSDPANPPTNYVYVHSSGVYRRG